MCEKTFNPLDYKDCKITSFEVKYTFSSIAKQSMHIQSLKLKLEPP